MRPRRGLLAALALGLAGCTFSSGVLVRSHELLRPLEPGLVNSFNVEERLERGFIPEVLTFLGSPGGRSLEQTRFARVSGQALLERGDFRGARVQLERAHAEEARLATRADLAWLLSQATYWDGQWDESARWGRVAQSEGRRVPDGWITFLESGRGRRLYDGLEAGSRLRSAVSYGRPNLIRLPIRINQTAPDVMVLDTGASISLVTKSAAERFGIEIVPDAEAYAYGLHDTEIPLRFGWARTLELGGVTLTNVPFGILEDEALAFQTTAAGSMKFSGVLGAHLMKEFDWRIEYAARQVAGVRLDPGLRRGGPEQNLFFRRLKPMVRTSFNQEAWFLFLLDTGSEPTMVTRSGIRRAKTKDLESNYPMTLEGIGKSRVSWGKMSNATVGVDRFMVRFDDLVVKEESLGIEDGVVGSSLLSHFDIEILFGAMRVRLERPFERRLQAAGEEGGPPVPR